MRKIRIHICEYCNKEYETRLKTTCCSKNCSNKLQGITRKLQINSETGLTKSQEIALKSAKTMKENGWYSSEDHLKSLKHTPEVRKKRGESIRQTKLTIDESTGMTRAALTTKKASETKIKKGIYIDPKFKDKFILYREEVRLLTEKNDLSSLEGFNERGRAGVKNAKHLDHIFSIKAGFVNNINPVIISSICNLRFISYKENISKKDRCDINLEELLVLYTQLESENRK